jgi:DNA integrity scanning protein DisA with diadenylate cyclase activity
MKVAFLVFGGTMAFATNKRVNELEKRIEALEERLGEVPVPSVESVITLNSVYGEDLAALLQENGYSTVEQVALASDEDLLAVKGIGPASLKQIRSAE